ncbi:MAG: choice-of-anchor L domain-containing protein [Myxococcales bacterium]|nr:choice-of-anchor L domain-containing protein [Myxococcales bacterium]
MKMNRLRNVAFAAAALAGLAAAPLAGCGSDSGSSSGFGGTGAKDGGLGGVGGGTGGSGNTGGSVGGSGGTGGGTQCPGATLCDGQCVQTDYDPNNCGACGTKCATGELCSAGQCAGQCKGGTTECSNKCVDTQIDPANCGACGTACATGQVCSAGQCASSCLGATTECSGKCVDTQIDPANCGACGTACTTGQVCSAGQCASQCLGGTVLCGNKCVDTQIDPANCGACGTACQSGEVCSTGTCGLTCSGGTTKCGTVCVDTNTDSANCGACGTACTGGQVCSNGTCSLQCSGGATKCGNTCVDTNTDPGNCGGCGNACPTGQVCSGGTCSLQCSGGTTKCGNTCVDTKTDGQNCGTCGTACGSGQVCNNGACASVCGSGLTKCGNFCVNTQTDGANCGSCGNACAPGATCVTGTCQQCNSATTDCDGDGWLVSEGDCCDKPGTCGSEPQYVNPGAVEVVGNGIDDNCNAKVDLFDQEDALPCDQALASNSSTPGDYAKAMGICRTTTENPAKNQKTWGLITAEILRADGSALGDARARSIRPKFGTNNVPIEGGSMAVLSSGIAADGTQTNPGPNGGAPSGSNVSTTHAPASTVNISTCTDSRCIKDWFTTANLPLKAANALPVAPNCGSGTSGGPATPNDSVMLRLRLRAPTNARAFSFNSYFLSAEYPEFVCTSYNDQVIALVDTPSGTPSPIANPVDKNLMTYLDSSAKKWPIGINIAAGTSLFAVCENQATNPSCWDTDVNSASCAAGISTLLGTGFDKQGSCTIGGGTYWLTTAGNVIPGQIVELRIVVWDVGDTAYDSATLLDGFKWLSNATLPGTG